MVEKIIAAAHSVLVERGYAGASTNRIAAAAGISPGSFYQYFPDKQAVLGVVVERYAGQMRARITSAFMATLAEPSPEAAVRSNVVTLLDVFEENAALLRAVAEALPRAWDGRRAEFTHLIDDLLAAFLGFRQPERDADAVAWVLVRAVENLTISYVLDPPPVGRETIIDEITALLAGYLASRLG
jgi:AcrR family transcriptional regulator